LSKNNDVRKPSNVDFFKAATLCETRILAVAAVKSKYRKHMNVARKMCLTIWEKMPIIIIIVVVLIFITIIFVVVGSGGRTRELQQDLTTGEGKYAGYFSH